MQSEPQSPSPSPSPILGIGLVNIGNTCFLNSCLQILIHTNHLDEYMDKTTAPGTAPSATISDIYSEYNALRIDYTNQMDNNNNKSSSSLRPNRLVMAIHNHAMKTNATNFMGWSQNDICEFLYFFIEGLQLIVAPNDTSFTNTLNSNSTISTICQDYQKHFFANDDGLKQLFYGFLCTKIIDVEQTKILSAIPEAFLILTLPVPLIDRCNLEDCLNQYTGTEFMHSENAWERNDNSGIKENVWKTTSICACPQILVIMLNRCCFLSTGRIKNNSFVTIPVQLGITTDAVSYGYELYGVCNHIGNDLHGHYTASVKSRCRNNNWIHCNDESVCEINIDDVIGRDGRDAYCIFYTCIKKELINPA